MLTIKPSIVEESSHTRQLELADRLSELLAKVQDYKAIRKFEALLYAPPPESGGKHFNRHYQDLALTDFGFFLSERYGRLEFAFYRLKNPNNGKRDELTFTVTEKTIPAIVQGLKQHRANLERWISDENDAQAYECGIEKEIERQFEGELTRVQFENKRRAVATLLRTLADRVEASKAKG